ncbi:iron ABC transporter permease [Paenibacillus sp. YSY-4.3]
MFRWFGIGGLCLLVAAAFTASLMYGIVHIPAVTVWNAFIDFDGSMEQLIIRDIRLPRALIALMVGSSLAIAGTIMQALSRNALAGPDLLGVNNGAALAAVIMIFLLHYSSLQLYIWSAFLGAGAAGLTVFLLGSMGSGRLTPTRLVLAGATLNLLLAALTQGVLILNQQSMDTMRFWLAGSLTGRDMGLFLQVLPYMLVGTMAALMMGRSLNLISLGEEVAGGLGQRVVASKIVLIGIVMLLAGSSVAIAGPIGFIGLAVPHIARAIVGSNHYWLVPYSACLGAALLLIADVAARFVLPGQEIPVGVVTVFLGAPLLIYLTQAKEVASP